MTFYRKVIKISAEDSPNVRLAMAEIDAGKEPSGNVLIPGVLTYDEYKKRRKLWDRVLQCVSLDGEFYEGEEIKLFPQDWVDYSIGLYKGGYNKPTALGVDTAEGGDSTVWTLVNPKCLIKIISKKTPDTSVIVPDTINLIKEHNLNPHGVYFDQGGGGKEHVDILRKLGYSVNAVFFGESATEEKDYRKRWKSPGTKLDILETKFTYKNRRAELYHKASLKMNPAYEGFGLIPIDKGEQYEELYRQLKVMPKLTDEEGRYYLPPKRPRPNSSSPSIEQMIGCSPDEADSFVLALWGLENRERVVRI